MPAALRPLPSRLNLEFEHKEAKALLRRLRSGDPESLERGRARHPGMDASRVKLADAQLVIAREYGFTSWPKLVRYFDEAHKQRWNSSLTTVEGYDSMVRAVLIEHRDRRIWTARLLACFVPRFYGMRPDDVFAATVTENEARLAEARSHGFPSWDALLECTAAELPRQRDDDPRMNARRLAYEAMEAGDLAELKHLVAAHPELLHPSEYFAAKGGRILASALHRERTKGADVMQPIIAWLESQGLDVQLELNMQLCSWRNGAPEVRWLLNRGADPNWIAPNGFPVLEHALLRLHAAEAVDVIAKSVVPRKALWIAAGLGDVEGVRRSLDSTGRPTKAATRLRPPFGIAGPFFNAQSPEPDDEELLVEAFLVAMIHSRTKVLEYMVSRGFPLNTLSYGQPMVNVAVGNVMPDVVECLVRCCADLNLRGWRPNNTAREIAAENFLDAPQYADRRRIVELCGLDPDKLLAERAARAAQ